MIRILKFLLTGDWHVHQWEDIDHKHIYECDPFTGELFKHSSFTRYYCKCKICGKHRRF